LLLICLSVAHSALAQKRIAYLRNNAAADYATHDRNIIAALGSAGITIGDTFISGLGYTIIEFQQGTEPDPIDTSVADLIFISQTISSWVIRYHTDDPVPIVNTESELFDDDLPPRSEMYFSTNRSTRFDFRFDILNNTHPITSVFSRGNLTV